MDWVGITVLKPQAMRNLAVSITYRAWRGPRCDSLLSLARPLKPTRPRDHCAAAVPPSPPFCSRKDVHDWVDERCSGLAMDWSPQSLHLDCRPSKNNSNNTKMNLNVGRTTSCLVSLMVYDACVGLADGVKHTF